MEKKNELIKIQEKIRSHVKKELSMSLIAISQPIMTN